MRTRPSILPARTALLLLLTLAFVTPAHAQFGALKDRLKKKVVEAVAKPKGDDSAPASTSANAETSEEREPVVLPLNDANLTRFEKGADSLRVVGAWAKKKLATVKSAADGEACENEFATTDEYIRIMTRLSEATDPKAIEAIGDTLKIALHHHCGYTMGDAEYVDPIMKAPQKAAAKAAGMTDEQFAIMLERMTPFFSDGGLKASANAPFKLAYDKYHSLAYTAEEVAALQAHAAKLQAMIKSLL
jgi:hypothetical protein